MLPKVNTFGRAAGIALSSAIPAARPNVRRRKNVADGLPATELAAEAGVDFGRVRTISDMLG